MAKWSNINIGYGEARGLYTCRNMAVQAPGIGRGMRAAEVVAAGAALKVKATEEVKTLQEVKR